MSNHDTSSHRIAARPLRALGYHITSRVRCAARYARYPKVSIHEAAKVFGVSTGGVWNAWCRIYPCQAPPLMDRDKAERRKGCLACGATDHHSRHGRCSPSAMALRLISGGLSVRQAADRVGATPQSVYKARKYQRRAA